MEYQTTCTRVILPPKNKKGAILDSNSGTKSRFVNEDNSEVIEKHHNEEPEFTSPPRQIHRNHTHQLSRKRSFSVDIRFSPKNEQILRVTPSGSRRRANTSDCENLIGTTISFDCFDDSNENLIECEHSSSDHNTNTSNTSYHHHHTMKDAQEGPPGSRRRRLYTPMTPHSIDIECGKCFAQTSSESPIVTSSNHRQYQSSAWTISIRILMSLGFFVLLSTSVGNVLVESSSQRKLPTHALERTDDVISNVHTVKNFGTWGLTLEDEEPSYIENHEKLPEQTRKKRRPILSAANNLSSQQWNTQQGVYVPNPKKIREFVMTDDEITKKTALLNDEIHKVHENQFEMDMVWWSLPVAFVGAVVISMYKQTRNMKSFPVHMHSR